MPLKRLFMWRLFVALFFVLRGLASAEIEVRTDRFDGTTQIVTKSQETSRTLSIYLFGIPSSTPKVPPYISIWLRGSFDEWWFLECFSTKWLLDGHPFLLPEATHEGSVSKFGVHETIDISHVSMKQIELMARAKKIEFKVCNIEFSATAEELQDLRTFFVKMKELLPK